jgi:hypothetical protein
LSSVNALALEPTVVVLEYSVYPESFMPGDAGVVTVTIRNSALATPIAEGTSSEQTTETDGSTDTHTQQSGGFYATGTTQNTTTDQSSQSSTEQSTLYYPMDANITLARLHGTSQFLVESPEYEDLGRIGPGDTVTFTFVVRASIDVSAGIYFMLFTLETDEPDVYTNYQIPLKVDDTPLRLILSNQPQVFGSTPGDLVFDVVNLRSSDVSMVYIESQSDSFSFSPAEYYIGAMDSGEMFTAQLSATYNGTGAQQTASFNLQFKNGDNWHESDPLSLTLDTVSTQEPEEMEIPVPGLVIIAAVLIISITYYAYRRSRRKKKKK